MAARARPGLAVVALGVILAVTATWWALALYPAGAAAPQWLLRTRLACFGAGPDALPNAGGWVLLVGEPLGMLGILVVGWRAALVRDLRLLLPTQIWRWRGKVVSCPGRASVDHHAVAQLDRTALARQRGGMITQLRPQGFRRRFVENVPSRTSPQDDPVHLARTCPTDQPRLNIRQHPFGIALERIAVSAAAGG